MLALLHLLPEVASLFFTSTWPPTRLHAPPLCHFLPARRSMRFYEALALGVVPVVRSMKEDAHRSPEELFAGYSVALAGDDTFPEDTSGAVAQNLKLFEKLHLLPAPCVTCAGHATSCSRQ